MLMLLDSIRTITIWNVIQYNLLILICNEFMNYC